MSTGLTDIASYPPTMRLFLGHWQQVNDALQPTPPVTPPLEMKLVGNFGRADLAAMLTLLEARIAQADNKDEELRVAAQRVQDGKEPLRVRFEQLRKWWDSYLHGTSYRGKLPRLPSSETALSDWARILNDAAQLWRQVNNDATLTQITRPVLLPGGYTVANFTADASAFNSLLTARDNLFSQLGPLAIARDDLMKVARERMLRYRSAVPATLPAGSPLIATIPIVTAKRHPAPDAVRVEVHYKPGDTFCVVRYSEAKPDGFARYIAQICVGPKWKADDARDIADITDRKQLEFRTPDHTIEKGTTNWIKVVVETEDGRVASSEAVKVVGV